MLSEIAAPASAEGAQCAADRRVVRQGWSFQHPLEHLRYRARRFAIAGREWIRNKQSIARGADNFLECANVVLEGGTAFMRG
jgi:hypothetical protein